MAHPEECVVFKYMYEDNPFGNEKSTDATFSDGEHQKQQCHNCSNTST